MDCDIQRKLKWFLNLSYYGFDLNLQPGARRTVAEYIVNNSSIYISWMVLDLAPRDNGIYNVH